MNGTMHFPTMTVEEILRMESNHRADQNPPVILVVDDERVIADTLSVILGRNGFAVMTAYNGTSALEIATLVPPQLLISDVTMPGMNGIDLAIAIRDAVPNCEVILFSARAFTADLLASARLAGLDFMALTKPVHPTEMLARVSERLALRKEVPVKRTGTQTNRVEIGPKWKIPFEAIGSGIRLSGKLLEGLARKAGAFVWFQFGKGSCTKKGGKVPLAARIIRLTSYGHSRRT